VRGAALSFAGLVFNQLRQSLIAGGDYEFLLPDVRVMYAVSTGKDLFGERQKATC